MKNHEYCARWAIREARLGRILDYGCGAGELVTSLRLRGIDAYGCDRYYEGVDCSDLVPEATRPFVMRMTTDRIPFDDASFDCVLSNQVLEHVPDLPLVAAEIARVLKPGGTALHIFPDTDVWLEGHANIPFLHWFGRGSRLRVYYAIAMCGFGFGLPRRGMTFRERYAKKCVWLDDWTHYRSLDEILSTFSTESTSAVTDEQWLEARFDHLPLPRFGRRWLARKAAGVALIVRKY